VQLVTPKTYLIGFTQVNAAGMMQYLKDTGQELFARELNEFVEGNAFSGAISAEALVSFYAKLCYASLVPGKNPNLSKVRSITDNLKEGVLKSAHGSVLEHANLNFVTTDCSRVLTHELVRHRAGTAFSQTSGRYVRPDGEVKLVLPPDTFDGTDLYDLGMALDTVANTYARLEAKYLNDPKMAFDQKKRITSALRRILPNGMANEIGWSMNARALRHTIQMRTHHSAEWEIRKVFGDVYKLCCAKWPILFSDAVATEVDGLTEVTGMRMLPYDQESKCQ
jgi:thymidylate synthase (FAD)